MTTEELTEKYKLIPNELKTMKRWVCFKVETLTDQPNKTTKRPYNAITGKLARVNDEMTWSSFNIAINGCFKYNMHGIGFVLGNGMFGIDLDNHINEDGTLDYPENEFDELCNEFINSLNSYTEYSQSGNGIHIICEGKLPEGRRRKKGVETYDTNRFFAFTGNAIKNVPIKNCENEIIPLWDKYVADKLQQENEPQKTYINTNREIITLNDQEIIDTIKKILLTYKDKINSIIDDTLKIIEDEYNCPRIKTLHKLIVDIEQRGGKYYRSLEILLDDFNCWVKRVYKYQDDIKQIKRNSFIGIILDLIIVIFPSLSFS